jgi:hypothetical protein
MIQCRIAARTKKSSSKQGVPIGTIPLAKKNGCIFYNCRSSAALRQTAIAIHGGPNPLPRKALAPDVADAHQSR